ncbi:DUF6386 family protein [Cupriavidus pauculus]|uniref:DUF6386 family protein n=1 Tax=Cupriavidus pauculus TaxID=82633 RepID=UPI001D0CBFBF|nr:DUF6386 family protein [Cupriavidus pauculus]
MRTTVTTGTSTIVLFDPECMSHRLNESADWWSLPKDELLEVNRANAAFLNVNADGVYELEAVLHDDLAEADVELVLRNTSGRFFFGAGEMMSSDGLQPEAEHGNIFIEAQPGLYLVRAHERNGKVSASLTPTRRVDSNAFHDLLRLGIGTQKTKT